MDHVSDIDLIAAAAGRLPPERQAELDAHVAGCADCQRRLADVSDTWELLGEWRLPAHGRDLREDVLAEAARRDRLQARPAWRRWAGWAAAAAAVIAAVAAGYAAGRLATSGRGGGAGSPTDAAAAAAALKLDVLTAEPPVGLARALLEERPDTPGEGS